MLSESVCFTTIDHLVCVYQRSFRGQLMNAFRVRKLFLAYTATRTVTGTKHKLQSGFSRVQHDCIWQKHCMALKNRTSITGGTNYHIMARICDFMDFVCICKLYVSAVDPQCTNMIDGLKYFLKTVPI